MKVYLEYNGNLEGTSPRRAFHTYDEKIALEIYENIRNRYLILFNAFLEKIKKRAA